MAVCIITKVTMAEGAVIVMNGYEFTRFEVDFTSKVKAQAYEMSIVTKCLTLIFYRYSSNFIR